MNPVRRAINAFSIRNRTRKGARISDWMDRHNVRTVLMVGALPTSPGSNVGIVEDAIMRGREGKVGIALLPHMVADARDMPFEDDYVDFALANAVIEHVGGEPEQRRMVEEHCRVA